MRLRLARLGWGVLAVGLVMPRHLVAATTITGQVTLSGTPPALVAVPTLTFASQPLAFFFQPEPVLPLLAAGELVVDDFSGQESGWTVTLSYTEFTHAGTTWPVRELRLHGAPVAPSDPAAPPATSAPVAFQAPAATPTAVWHAAAGFGEGHQVARVTSGALALVPQRAPQAGVYTSTLTWTLAQTPAATSP